MSCTNINNFALFGYPVAQSLSPIIHEAFARQYNLDINYSCMAVKELELRDCLKQFIAAGGRGVNITAPLKELSYRLVSNLSKRALATGSVNTLTMRNGIIWGDNTDGIGFIRDATQRHAIAIEKQRILILGAGGVVRGILSNILELGPLTVTIANRDLSRVDLIAKDFAEHGEILSIAYTSLKNQAFDLIINGSSASADQLAQLLPAQFNFQAGCCYDLNYRENSGSFSALARAKGATRTINGLGMLVEQAAESFKIWHGVQPLTEPVLVQLQQTTGQISAVYSV